MATSRDDSLDSDRGTSFPERFVAILTALAEEGRPLGVAEIAKAADMPASSVHRLLGGLMTVGWVTQDATTSRYRLGQAMLGTAAVALTMSPLLERAQPALNRITEIAGVGALLAVRVGRNVVYLSRAAGPESPRNLAPSLQPAHCTASGKVLLAFMTPQARQRLYRDQETLRRFTDKTITSVPELEEELLLVRRRGYAIDDCELRDYQRAVAVPVHNANGEVIAAITASGRAEIMTPEHLETVREEMSAIADDLSAQAGAVFD